MLRASRNIKEFGHSDERLAESYCYIAEIINRFDLVAIHEIKRTLDYHDYWKRNQMSDHYPVWIEVEIDSSDDFLEEHLQILNG